MGIADSDRADRSGPRSGPQQGLDYSMIAHGDPVATRKAASIAFL
jgi:hypothetical protein